MAPEKAKNSAKHIKISTAHSGRRIDNFLSGHLKGVPKTRIYQMLRKGEVRVNSARVKQDYRLGTGDDIRIPPLFTNMRKKEIVPSEHLRNLVQNNILYEDNYLIALNKPAGLAVHGGSGQLFGVIELIRLLKPEIPYLELVHRLDKYTSGCLLLAKEHNILRALHEALRNGKIEKHYLTLLQNQLSRQNINICLPLQRSIKNGGERKVRVHDTGKYAKTLIKLERNYPGASLVDVQIITGRTHQIRVHSAHIGHPVAGDKKYGDREFNKKMHAAGLRRIFLHAKNIRFISPVTGKHIRINAPVPAELSLVLQNL